MSTTATTVTPELEAYLAPLFWPEDRLLQDLARDLAERGPQIQVSAEEGRLLAMLVTLSGARRVLEVGTLFGYSGVWMGRAMGPSGHLDTVEFSPVHAEAARGWFDRAGLADRVTVHQGPALEVLPRLHAGYDLAFFDAAKSEYCDYLDHALRLVRPGGLILADNVFWNGRVAADAGGDADVRGIRDYNARIASDPRLTSTVIPVGDGLSVSVVR
ncbi:MAG: putative O-methyltransferase [Chloroflexi bacterium]|jgi:caffeoyl-CoA O-methyltransferase|nr:putative O-methyltransferase [Chloroflexota bacterium]